MASEGVFRPGFASFLLIIVRDMVVGRALQRVFSPVRYLRDCLERAVNRLRFVRGQDGSRADVNADIPISIVLLVDLAAHEAYPGHPKEWTVKEAHLYRDLGRLDASVVITSACDLRHRRHRHERSGRGASARAFDVVAVVLADMDVRFDPIEAHEFHRAEMAL